MNNASAQTSTDEIRLADISSFLIRNRVLILIFVAFGLLLSLAYATFTPKIYEARWQLEVAQSNGKALEPPTVLMQRLRAPTTYTEDVRKLCGMPINGDFGDNLGGKLKIAATKGILNMLEFKVSATSASAAHSCAKAITAMIFSMQNKLIEEQSFGSRQQMSKYQESLAEASRQMERIRKSEVVSFAYLSHLDKSNWLRDRIDALQIEALAVQPAKLLTPIQVPGKHVSPKMSLALILGGLIGMIAGILGALIRERSRTAL